MKALVVTCRDPFRPANHRSVATVRRRHSLRALAPKTQQPVICQVNGQWISRQAWNRRVTDGDCVVFVTLPQDGGQGSDPLRIVLMIAVAYFAPFLATEMYALAGGTFVAANAGTIISAMTVGVGIAGAMLVNALIPPPRPPQAQQAASLAASSPTYSLGAQGNAARLGQPIPVIYGRHVVYPDFAAMPYVEYAGNEQFLYQLFCVGCGEYEIEAIRIEDTPISVFDEITYEIVPPGGEVTLFPASVITALEVSGQEALTDTALGPFVANAAGTTINALAIDVVASRGLYYANNSGGLSAVSCTWKVEARRIDDLGAPAGAWVTIGLEELQAATTTPQRRSYKYSVPSGRYEVRLTRLDTKETDSRYGHELDWVGLRAYLPGAQTYGNVTVVAMRMQATNSLSTQASRKINMIVTRKLRTWSPEYGWSATAVPTRSIAWALADVCRADYGAGLSDTRIDLAGLATLDAVWSARGDCFDAVFDSPSTIMEGLTQIARAGRAVPYVQGGIVHAARDAAQTIPVGMFSQRNIVRGSFSLEYLMPGEETADAVDVTYFDADIWSERTVRAALPDSTSSKPAQVKLFGVTSRQQAWQEGMHIAACNRYRRRLLGFTTEMEGFIPSVADLIAVQHDMPKWGQSGEIVGFDPVTKIATVSEPLDWSAGGAHVLALRRRDGSVAGPYACIAGADAYHVTLSDWVSGTDPLPDTGPAAERSHYAFGPANSQYIRARVLAVRPRSAETVDISAVVESDYVHAADTGTAPGVGAWQLTARNTVPMVVGLCIRSMPSDVDMMVLSWQPAAGADRYIVEQGNNDGNWTRVAETSGNTYAVRALYSSATVVRVCAVGITRGPWIQINYAGVADYMWSVGDDAAPMWIAGDDTDILW